VARTNGSPLRDFRIKETDTKNRLGRVFAAFVKVPTGAYFITGGKEPPFLYGNESFKCVCVGNDELDVSEGEHILREIGSAISSTFSEEDLHALVVANYVSRVTQFDLEDLHSPRGVAAEFIIFDVGEKVLKVHYDGNVETEELGTMKEKFTLVGAYNPVFRRTLLEELRKAPADVTSDNLQEKIKEIEKVAFSIKKKLKLKHIGVLM